MLHLNSINKCNIAPISSNNKSSEAQQTTSFGVVINGDKQESSLENRTAENIWLESNFRKNLIKYFFYERWVEFQIDGYMTF